MNLANSLANAIELHKSGDLQSAKIEYIKILNIEPTNPDANHLLGLVELVFNNYTDAKKLLEQAIKSNPKQAEFYNSLGHFYLSTYNNETELNKAIEFFEKSKNLNPNLESSTYNLAIANEKKGNTAKAIELYKTIIKRNNNNIDALNSLGTIYAKLRDKKNAENYFKLALHIDKNNKFAYNNLGNLYLEFSDFQSALLKFKEALAIDCDFLTAKVNIANTMLANKKVSAAANEFYDCLNQPETKWQSF